MYYTYVIRSKVRNYTYIGQCNNLEKRIKEHNKGKVQSTKPYVPLELKYYEKFETREEAVTKEKYYKTTTGRKLVTQLIQNAEMAELVDALDSKSSEAQTS